MYQTSSPAVSATTNPTRRPVSANSAGRGSFARNGGANMNEASRSREQQRDVHDGTTTATGPEGRCAEARQAKGEEQPCRAVYFPTCCAEGSRHRRPSMAPKWDRTTTGGVVPGRSHFGGRLGRKRCWNSLPRAERQAKRSGDATSPLLKQRAKRPTRLISAFDLPLRGRSPEPLRFRRVGGSTLQVQEFAVLVRGAFEVPSIALTPHPPPMKHRRRPPPQGERSNTAARPLGSQIGASHFPASVIGLAPSFTSRKHSNHSASSSFRDVPWKSFAASYRRFRCAGPLNAKSPSRSITRYRSRFTSSLRSAASRPRSYSCNTRSRTTPPTRSDSATSPRPATPSPSPCPPCSSWRSPTASRPYRG